MSFLLDTNACIHFLNGTYPQLTARAVDAGPDALKIATPSLAELSYGAARSARPNRNRARIRRMLQEIPVLPFDPSCAERFGVIKADLVGRGKRVPDFDIAIAATAFIHGATVVTDDRHFDWIPGLTLENWTRAT